MTRSFLHPDAWPSSALTGDEARHLSQVLRIQPGETITVFDGAGRSAEARVLHAARDRVTLAIGEIHDSPPPQPSLVLAQAIPKGKNMELIVQKAVELGVTRIQPLVTRNTVVRPADHKADKWRRIALEACKQCGRDSVPEINEPMPFIQWLAAPSPDDGLRLIASLAESAQPMRETLRRHPGATTATMLIGPEGDFTPGETETALSAGFLPVSLGTIVLRVETAALYCISVLRYELS